MRLRVSVVIHTPRVNQEKITIGNYILNYPKQVLTFEKTILKLHVISFHFILKTMFILTLGIIIMIMGTAMHT